MPKPKISDEAAKKATGKNWKQWFALLDKAGAKNMVHRDIARMLRGKYKVRDWWSQMVTVEYEYARGNRIIGQTETAGFEIGVQKMFPIPQKQAWQLVTSSKGRRLWLGDAEEVKFRKGFVYKTKEGMRGEIRTIKPGERLRLTWSSKKLKRPSTLQVTLICRRNTPNKTMIHFHQEKLTSAKEREQMRKHWQGVLEKFSKI